MPGKTQIRGFYRCTQEKGRAQGRIRLCGETVQGKKVRQRQRIRQGKKADQIKAAWLQWGIEKIHGSFINVNRTVEMLLLVGAGIK